MATFEAEMSDISAASQPSKSEAPILPLLALARQQQQSDRLSQVPPAAAKLFVGGLHPATSDDGLRMYFSRFGVVESAVVMRDKRKLPV